MDTTGPAALAYQLADTTRRLNTATEKPTQFADVATVRDVAEGLQLTACQLTTALRQLGAGLRHIEETGAVRPDGATEASQPVSTALRALLNAEVAATLVRAALREAEAPLTALSATPSPEVRA